MERQGSLASYSIGKTMLAKPSISPPACTIGWNELSAEEWAGRFRAVPRSTILQDPSYAHAALKALHQSPRFGLIRMDGVEAGLVQILEAGLFKNAIHALILDRGPLWFEGFGQADHIRAFFDEFNRLFPARFGRKRRIIPEISDSPENRQIFADLGYKRLDRPGYQTIWLNLRQKPEILRASLKQKWRNILNRAEKSDLEMEWDREGKFLSWAIKSYETDRREKGYPGVSLPFLTALASTFGMRGDLLIGRAILAKKPVAGIIVLCHGSAATYQVGWTSGAGRKAGAHHILLWDSLRQLCERGVHDFDLGGINDQDADGVRRFKEGMGGEKIVLSGQYS